MRKEECRVIPVYESVNSNLAFHSLNPMLPPISGWTVRGNLHVNMVFGRDLFDNILGKFGRQGWNMYVKRLLKHSISASFSNPDPDSEEDFCMPVCLKIDLSGNSFRGMDLRGVDFSFVDLEKADFTGADLSGSVVGDATGASFRNAVMTRTMLDGDISEANFEGAKTKWLRNRCANYFSKSPPIGLPSYLMKRMKPWPLQWETHEKNQRRSKDNTFQLKPISSQLCSFWGSMP